MAVPTSINISIKVYYEISENEDLEIEMEKTTTVPEIVGALRVIKKYINMLRSCPSQNKILKKITFCGIAHLFRCD